MVEDLLVWFHYSWNVNSRPQFEVCSEYSSVQSSGSWFISSYFQAVESILKLYKLKRNRIEIDAPKIPAPFQPGIRPDNDWIQYTPNMSESDLAAYWKKPFSVKPEQGFYAYKKVTKLRVVDDRVLSEPDFLNEAYMNFFMDKSKVIY